MSKIFESVTADQVFTTDEIDKYQFGLKANHSTAMCISVFKQTVDYYRNHGSHVFACFVDFVKAFDYVNYWKLLSFCKIMLMLIYTVSQKKFPPLNSLNF